MRRIEIEYDPAIPQASLRFGLSHDIRGPRLALVFGNHWREGRCPFAAAGGCHHCDIGLGEGVRFDIPTNLRRVKWLKEFYRWELDEVVHLVIYNSGSTLNPKELPGKVAERIVEFAASLPALEVLSMESREFFVKAARIRAIAGVLGRQRALRVIMGLESGSESVRNGVLQKAMKLERVARALEALRMIREEGQRGREVAEVGVAFNVLVGAPGVARLRSVEEAVDTALLAVRLARESGLPVEINIHPYYRSGRGGLHFPEHRGPSIATVCRAIIEIARTVRDSAVLFVGLNDEGHDQGKRFRRGEVRIFTGAVEDFNRTGSTTRLAALAAPGK